MNEEFSCSEDKQVNFIIGFFRDLRLSRNFFFQENVFQRTNEDESVRTTANHLTNDFTGKGGGVSEE